MYKLAGLNLFPFGVVNIMLKQSERDRHKTKSNQPIIDPFLL